MPPQEQISTRVRPPGAPLLDYAGPSAARPRRITPPTRLEWCVIVGLFLLLVTILMPSLGRPRINSVRIACAANIRSVGQAIHLYAQDHGGAFPDTLEQVVTSGYIRDPRVLLCPASDDTLAASATAAAPATDLTAGGHLSYIYTGRDLTDRADPATVIAYEYSTNHEDDEHRSSGGNVLFADGHAGWFGAGELRRLADRFAAGERPVVWKPHPRCA